MYENLVSNVTHHLDKDGRHCFHYQTKDNPPGYLTSFSMDDAVIGAIETWLAQPKVPTPEERAMAVLAKIREAQKTTPYIWQEYDKEVTRILAEMIQAALDADRAQR